MLSTEPAEWDRLMVLRSLINWDNEARTEHPDSRVCPDTVQTVLDHHRWSCWKTPYWIATSCADVSRLARTRRRSDSDGHTYPKCSRAQARSWTAHSAT